jgi:catechol 2,3-dioxygenase-like lactoylglutathione lyase family enzyme
MISTIWLVEIALESAVTKKLIALGLKSWVASVRVRRALRITTQPKLGGLDHVTIPVHDLRIARSFYCDFLGATYLMTVDDETFRRFGRPPAPNHGDGAHHISVYMGSATRIDLFLQAHGQAPAQLGHPHFAFEVPPGALSKWQRKLAGRGIPMEGPLQLGPPGQASLYFNDPFGNHLEIATLGYTGAVEIRPPVMERVRWPIDRTAVWG